jgi:CheY-like chemotaxis protein
VVGEAADGAAGVAEAARLRPDLVVLDLSMPGMDGLTAIPHLRRDVPGATVVVLSAQPSTEMAPVVEAAGAVGYLEKGGSVSRLASDLHALATVVGAMESVLRQDLPSEAQSASRAREAVTSALITAVPDAELDTLVLLTGELVKNVVAHAGAGCHLAVELRPDAVRVSVSDAEPGGASPADVGRGLALVETLSSAWGTATRGGGRIVWFEVARSSA